MKEMFEMMSKLQEMINWGDDKTVLDEYTTGANEATGITDEVTCRVFEDSKRGILSPQ